MSNSLEPKERLLYEMFAGWRGAGVHKWHHYLPIYDRLFAPLRHQSVNLLEIGVGGGGSLHLWREYFGPSAMIAGCDVDPTCIGHSQSGFRIFIGDQADPAFLERMLDDLPPLDVVIDDGGHTANQQITTFDCVYPRMSRTGTYIVEDTHTSYWPEYMDRRDGLTFVEYAKTLCDQLTAWHVNMANLERLAVPPDRRIGLVAVPEFTKSTLSITFMDSLVVFQRAPITEPWHEQRS